MMNNKLDYDYLFSCYMKLVYCSNEILKTFPKSENYGVIKEIKNSLYDGLKLLMYSEKEVNKEKYIKLISDLDANLEIIKVLFEIAYKCNYITLDNYNKIDNLIENIPINAGELQ